MKTVSGKRMCQILETKGWNLARINGSHHIYVCEGEPLRISVPVHGNQSLKSGLQRHFMRLADIHEKDL
ncbi:MAG: type II toxin-antitoxin system HicA family toxin [Candidatus Hydrogenedentes bacterium]|nr:type II toxin-antitoxin system HicA family toxin [Candidatus Hydrogenedentota bacterium]